MCPPSPGGVTLLRAAAKNNARVTVLCDPGDYNRSEVVGQVSYVLFLSILPVMVLVGLA